MMQRQVTVFGADGRVGRQAVDELLNRGYDVVAFVHNDTSRVDTDQLRVVQGDIYSVSDVDRALEGSDAVLSCLGSWGTPKKDILATGMRHILASSHVGDITALISLTGADARAESDSLTIIHRLMRTFILIAAGKILIDGETHIRLLEQSGLDYTVIRSPVMSSKLPVDDTYVLNTRRPLPWDTISRRLVVMSLVDTLEDRTWSKKSPFLS